MICCDRYPMADVWANSGQHQKTSFHYATLASLTVSVWDAVIPPLKATAASGGTGPR